MTPGHEEDAFKIAIIGMSGRLPGARNLDEYWRNLSDGKEAITFFSDEELLRLGVSPERLSEPGFVKAGSVIEESALFAASFFGYSPREADLMDPQHRVMLECAWTALETAGYAAPHPKISVGVFAGSSLSTYMLFNLLPAAEGCTKEDEFQIMIGNDKDFLSTRLAYKLNLRGPTITVQTGCSTSLVATHLAAQSLLTYQCDLALAGGVSIGVPQRLGYRHQPGGIHSPDGHCRPFDAAAAGTIFGEGVGVVVMKRYEEAVRDGDSINAILLGSAINNDGSAKVGYTAPGLEGQVDVVLKAQRAADVTADSISYVETHGTGTALGDPIEISALMEAFQKNGGHLRYCGIGSVKSNIGHLDAAAGIAGLIKVVLMLQHGRLVPSLHFQTPNPKIDFQNSPFRVITKSEEWKSNAPRCAAVSSFGIGGANAHVILQEAPKSVPDPGRADAYILSLSAQTESALDHAGTALSSFLETATDESFPDAAYTLHVGRQAFRFRRSLVAASRQEGANLLKRGLHERVFQSAAHPTSLKIGFLFPGGGTQYPHMGRELYQKEPVFREEMDRCLAILKHTGAALRRLLYSSEIPLENAAADLMRTSLGLPAIFATEYALAKLLISWGIRPQYLMGHSLGEYTAACLAGVFSLETAMSLVEFRGRLFENLQKGAMLSVYLSEAELHALLGAEISIAAVNGPEQCVVSGPVEAVTEFSRLLGERSVDFRRLHIDAGAHSALVEPVLADFHEFLRRVDLNLPTIRFISNQTGTWITAAQATNPAYWVEHLRHTVRFSDGLSELMQIDDLALVEVGPSKSLSSLAKQQRKNRAEFVLPAMRHPQDNDSDLHVLYTAIARLWNLGVPVDWGTFYRHQRRRRIPLPTYPFERQRYWVDPPSEADRETRSRKARKAGAAQALAPSWVATEPLAPEGGGNTRLLWVLFMDRQGIGTELAALLRSQGAMVRTVYVGDRNALPDAAILPERCSERDLDSLFQDVSPANIDAVQFVHLSTLGSIEQASEMQTEMSSTLLSLLRFLNRISQRIEARLTLVSNGVSQVSGTDAVSPIRRALAAICRVGAQEFERLSVRVIDLCDDYSLAPARRRSAQHILAEVHQDAPFLVAYRGPVRWMPTYRVIDFAAYGGNAALRDGGVYLITGGLGELGPLVADSLTGRTRCTVILLGRSARLNPSDIESSPLASLYRTIRERGSELVVLQADIASEAEAAGALAHIYNQYKRLDGVFHLAGITGTRALQLLSDLDEAELIHQLRPKAVGSNVLAKLLADKQIDFCVLFSSTASALGGVGLAAYAAACSFLDAFAQIHALRSGQRWISIAWDGWLTRGSAGLLAKGTTAIDEFALSSEDALSFLHRILEAPLSGNCIVCRGDMEQRARVCQQSGPQTQGAPLQPPAMPQYVAPQNETQRQVADVWREVLGLERVGLNDNLFDLGGNSLIALRIVSKLARDLNIEIPVTVLFEAPTVQALSDRISSSKDQPGSHQAKERGELRRRKRASASEREPAAQIEA